MSKKGLSFNISIMLLYFIERRVCMKYSQLNYNDNKTTKLITLANYTVKQLEEMEEKGKFTFSGEKCTAAMCLVHNTKNGGRTCYFKATDDNAHSETCQFKIKNYKAHISMLKKTGGFFTSGQINDAVRRIYKEYTEPLDKKDVKRKKKESSHSSSKKSNDNDGEKGKLYANGGVIIYGENDGNGTKGRMSRRYHVDLDDVGIMAMICGEVESMYFDDGGEFIVTFSEKRLGNIHAKVGNIYKQHNSTEFENLYLFLDYFNNNHDTKKIIAAAGGLVEAPNGILTLDIQSNGGLRVDGMTIMSMMYNKAKNLK